MHPFVTAQTKPIDIAEHQSKLKSVAHCLAQLQGCQDTTPLPDFPVLLLKSSEKPVKVKEDWHTQLDSQKFFTGTLTNTCEWLLYRCQIAGGRKGDSCGLVLNVILRVLIWSSPLSKFCSKCEEKEKIIKYCRLWMLTSVLQQQSLELGGKWKVTFEKTCLRHPSRSTDHWEAVVSY